MTGLIRILLVEDNADDEHLALRALRKLEAPVEIAVVRDGQEALDSLFGTDAALPSIVLLDLRLPKVGGLQVLGAVRADDRTRDLPIVVMVSTDEPAEVREGYEQTADATMQKPIRLDEFASIARRFGLM
ncbi:MAG: response regulator [Fimbriimonas sp.]|nr:response regulator [Fimbriimonas sp.]